MKQDPNYIAKLEKAIEKKYGAAAIANPKSLWSPEKEKKFLEQSGATSRQKKSAEKEEISEDVFLVDKKTSETSRTCPVCGKFSLKQKNELYMQKFQACFECYIKYIENREERWNSGWRPKK
jgi:hypothetical protein